MDSRLDGVQAQAVDVRRQVLGEEKPKAPCSKTPIRAPEQSRVCNANGLLKFTLGSRSSGHIDPEEGLILDRDQHIESFWVAQGTLASIALP